MSNIQKPTGKEYIFELSGYILNCAEMVLSPRGNTRYSVLRYMDVLRRIIDIPEYADCIEKDPHLKQLKEKLGKLPIEVNQMEELRKGLQKLIIDHAEEATKRI